MAIGTSPILSELRGSVGPIDFRTRWNGKIEIGQKRIPANPQSTEQQNTRNAYGRLYELWKNATWIDKTPYDAIGKDHNISAWNAFLMRHLPTMRLNPVAYWPFVEGTGNTAHDFTPNNHHGTIYGAAWVFSDKYGIPRLDYDGIDDYITIPDSIIDLSEDCTIRSSIIFSPDAETENPRIISLIDSDGDNLQIGYMADSSIPSPNGFYIRLFDTPTVTIDPLLRCMLNNLTWIKKSGVNSLFINSVNKSTISGGIAANCVFSALGAGYTTSSFMLNGLMNEAVIFDYSISDEQNEHLDTHLHKFYGD